jgi:hypothetical protein
LQENQTLKSLDCEVGRFLCWLYTLFKVEQVLAALQIGFQNLKKDQFHTEIRRQVEQEKLTYLYKEKRTDEWELENRRGWKRKCGGSWEVKK